MLSGRRIGMRKITNNEEKYKEASKVKKREGREGDNLKK